MILANAASCQQIVIGEADLGVLIVEIAIVVITAVVAVESNINSSSSRYNGSNHAV